MKKVLLIVMIVLMTSLLIGCKDDYNNDDENVIYVTVYPMQFLLEEIGGETITTRRVPGSTNHSHEDAITFTAKDIIEMKAADMIFYVGGGVDTYIPNAAESTFQGATVELIAVEDYVEYAEVCYTGHDHEHPDEDPIETCDETSLGVDPHFWLDPVKMLQAAALVRDKLVVAYPDNSELYQNNFVVIEAALEKLNQDFQDMANLATKPIITTTMLFNYWHAGYDLEIMSLTSSVHTTTIDPLDMIELVDDALLLNIHYIMFEKNTNFPAGETILEQLQVDDPTAQAAYLHGLGNLTQEEIDNGFSYFSIMYENLDILNNATK